MSIFENKVRGDERGKLIALEAKSDIPFEVKRVFYIYGANNKIARGKHSHHVTRQYLIAVRGSCKIMLDDGKKKEIYSLDRPELGLLQEAMVWGEMYDFSDDCVLLVLASEHYDENDYIRDYQDFLRLH